MKKILLFVSIFGTLFTGVTSCNKFLETRPDDFLSPANYYETEAQLKIALNGVYDVMGNNALYAYRMHSFMGLDADEGYYNRSNLTIGVPVYDVSSTDAYVDGFWRYLYVGISRANMLLQNIHKPQMDESRRDVIRGEALFLRGYYYFLLVSNFNDVPLILDPVGSPSQIEFERTPAAEVYAQVVADMSEAETLVETATALGFGGRVNKSAVRGLLARVCLHMAGTQLNDVSKYADAREWARKVIESGEHELNPSYENVFVKYARDEYDIKESIWEVEFWGNRGGAHIETGRVGVDKGIQTSNMEIGFAYGFTSATPNMFELFSDRVIRTEGGIAYSEDGRREWAIAPFRYVGDNAVVTPWPAANHHDRHIGKWRRVNETSTPKDQIATPQNFPLLRYSDVLLMFAEAENELNGPAGAYVYINMVRRRGYSKPVHTPDPDVDLAGLSKEEFLQELQNERARELCFELHRKGDLIRWGIFLEQMKKVADRVALPSIPANRKFIALSYTNATERDVRWPIPNREIVLNPALTQNPGW